MCCKARIKKCAAFGWLSLSALSAQAQWRENQPSVVEPPTPIIQEEVDATVEFRKKYSAVGSPKIVLFWNVAFDDQLTATVEHLDTTTKSAGRQHSSIEKTTSGDSGSASLSDGDESSTESSVNRRISNMVDKAKRQAALSERDSAKLEIAFLQGLRQSGIKLLDRAALMRIAQSEKLNEVTDAKQIEAEAVIQKANLILQIQLIPDKASPIGSAFGVSIKKSSTGEEVSSFYTFAVPAARAMPGRYVATDAGYAWSQPNPETKTIADIGTQLAIEVLEAFTTAEL